MSLAPANVTNTTAQFTYHWYYSISLSSLIVHFTYALLVAFADEVKW